MRRLVPGLGLSLLALVAASCGVDTQKQNTPEKVGVNAQNIIGGAADTTDSATVFVYSNMAACSGTLIHVNGSYGYVLTAGHCTNMTGIVYIPTGASSYNDPSAQQFTVDQDTPDPLWTGNPSSGHDFRILRFSGANSSLTVVPAAPDPDGMAAGTMVDISGFGLTQSPPNGMTTDRMHVQMPIQQLDSMLLYFDQTGGQGACEGDSGGPAYATVNGQKMVVGVTSFGDMACAQSGASGRPSLDYNSFIAPTIGGAVMETCDSCFNSATATGGACYSKVQACEGDTAAGGCSTLVSCLNMCAMGNQTCVNNCASAASQTGISEYNAIFQCTYCGSCSAYCSQTDCGTGATTGAATTGALMTGTATSTGNASGATVGTGVSSGATSGATSGAGGSSGSGQNSSGGTHTVTTCTCTTVGSDSHGGALGFAGLTAALGLVVARRRRGR
jgi:hypothetical protein